MSAALQSFKRVFAHGRKPVNMTASRVRGVTYTNTTGRPILVMINGAPSLTDPSGSNYLKLFVDGTKVTETQFHELYGTSTFRQFISSLYAVVPNGSTYKLDGTVSDDFNIFQWWEL